MDAYTTALALLSRRELSAAQLRERLRRRRFAADEIETVLSGLAREGVVDDRRVAASSARISISKRRGRRRVLQHVQHLGIAGDIARAAVDEAFADIDEGALLDEALARTLKGADLRTLDQKAAARVVRRLVGQGFAPSEVYARLRRGRAKSDE